MNKKSGWISSYIRPTQLSQYILIDLEKKNPTKAWEIVPFGHMCAVRCCSTFSSAHQHYKVPQQCVQTTTMPSRHHIQPCWLIHPATTFATILWLRLPPLCHRTCAISWTLTWNPPLLGHKPTPSDFSGTQGCRTWQGTRVRWCVGCTGGVPRFSCIHATRVNVQQNAHMVASSNASERWLVWMSSSAQFLSWPLTYRQALLQPQRRLVSSYLSLLNLEIHWRERQRGCWARKWVSRLSWRPQISLAPSSTWACLRISYGHHMCSLVTVGTPYVELNMISTYTPGSWTSMSQVGKWPLLVTAASRSRSLLEPISCDTFLISWRTVCNLFNP